MPDKKYIYDSQKNSYLEVTPDNNQRVKELYESDKDRYSLFKQPESVGGDSTGKPVSERASMESSEELESSGDGLTERVGTSEFEESPKESRYLKGFFGDLVEGMDSPLNPGGFIGFGDFIDDMARAVGSGVAQGDVSGAAIDMLAKGKGSSEEDVEEYIAAANTVDELEPSQEYRDFQRTYQEEGEGVYGFIKGLAQNPSVVPEIMVSSITGLVTTPETAAAAGTVIGTGAGVGSVVPGLGTAAGATASVPFALGAANATLEAGATFSELLREEIGSELTKDNVRAVLEDEEALRRIRRKAVTRGVAIGTIDALTGKLGGSVGAKIAAKGTRGAKVLGTGTTAGIEAVGGSTGEAAARALIGQEMDVAEIGLEGIAELPMAAPNLAAETFAREQRITVKDAAEATKPKPKYIIDGESVTKDEFVDFFKDADLEDYTSIDSSIENDPKLEAQFAEEVRTKTLEAETKQAYPSLDNEKVSNVVDLQKKLDSLKENDTEAGKQKKSEIRKQIKEIITPPQEEQTTTQDENVQQENEQREEVQPTDQTTEQAELQDDVQEVAPEIKMSFPSNASLRKAKDVAAATNERNRIKEDYKQLRTLIDCLWKK